MPIAIDSLNFMLVEIVACLGIAALLGLFVGWMMRRSIAKRQAKKLAAEVKHRARKLEESSRADTKNLENRLQELGAELRTLKQNNHSLNESLRNTELSIHKARNDSIDLNQSQLETNERLQSIIRERDAEIARLMSTPTNQNPNLAMAASNLRAQRPQEPIVRRAAQNQQTDQADATEAFDATAIIGQAHLGVADDTLADTVAALDASTRQLRTERRALLDALNESEQTVAIEQSDLPLEIQNQRRSHGTRTQRAATHELMENDVTTVLDELDATVSIVPIGVEEDTELADTVEDLTRRD